MDRLRLGLLAVLNAACLAFVGFGFGPSLLHDGRLMFAEKVEAQGYPDVSCRVYGGLFHVCSVDPGTTSEELRDGVIHVTPTGKQQNVLFFGIGGSGPREPGKLFAAADDPAQVTTGFSLRVFWDRLITFLVFECIFLVVFVFTFAGMFQSQGAARRP